VVRHLTRESLDRAGFDITRQVHLIGPDYFEYSFSNEVWSKVLFTETNSDIWTPERVASLRTPQHSFVKKLLDETGILDKPKLGLVLAKNLTTPDDVPECLRNCINKAIEFAN
jgi:hypothetical protein